MKRRYDLGLNTRWPFINAREYLRENYGEGIVSGREEVQTGIDVPITEYRLNPDLKVRLIGDLLVDIRFLEIEGSREEISQILKLLRKNEVRMGLESKR